MGFWISIAFFVSALSLGGMASSAPMDGRLAQADSLFGARNADAALQVLDGLLLEAQRDKAQDLELKVRIEQARIHGNLGHPVPGRTSAAAALQIASSLHDTLSTCRALRWLAVAAQQEGNTSETRSLAHRLLDLARLRDDPEHEAHGNLLLGASDRATGDLGAAIPEYERAVALFEETGNRRLESIAREGLGNVLEAQGDVDSARSCYLKVLVESRKVNDPWTEADALNDLGVLEFDQGDPSAAREFYRQAYDLQARHGNLAGTIFPATNLAVMSTYMGEWDEAMEMLVEAQRVCEEFGYGDRLAVVFEQMGHVRKEQGRLAEAAALFRQAASQASGMSTEVYGRAICGLAETLVLRDSVDAGVTLLRSRLDPIRRDLPAMIAFKTDRICGFLLMESDRLPEALERFQRADRAGKALGFGYRVAPLTGAGWCYSVMGHPDSARACLDRAVDAWESERARIRDPIWREQLEMDARNLYAELARQLLECSPSTSPEERSRAAFESLQRFKARTLRERMLGASSLGEGAIAGAPTASATLAELQATALDEDEILLDAFMGTDGLYLFGVTRRDCRSCVVSLPTQKWSEALRRYRDLLARPPNPQRIVQEKQLIDDASRRLSDMILLPFADLLETHSRVTLALDGILNLVPIEALPFPAGDTDHSQPFAAGWRIVRTPSATVRMEQRIRTAEPSSNSRAARILAILDGPEAGETLPPGALAEVRWLNRSFRGSRIERVGADHETQDWVADLSGCEIIHLASHIRINDAHPWRSGPAHLRAQQIAAMRLPARLAFLAGCESAGGRVVSGEGVLGLTAAFTAANVPSVIATLWPVSDRVTARLTRLFYTSMEGGMTVGDALRAAQMRIRNDPRTSHPFYWAGFVLVGDGDARIPIERRAPSRIPAALLGCAAGLAALVWLARRGRRPAL